MSAVGVGRAVLGRTGISVSKIGLGAGPLGDLAVSDADADALLRRAIDLGINVIDTAPSYGASEDRIGRLFAANPELRDRVVCVTKGGYGVPGVADWTPEVITRGVDRALSQLRTDYLDVFLFHSCPPRDDLIDALLHVKASGRVRAIGYSGDGDGLTWAAGCDAFDVIECSVNIVDQRALDHDVPRAVANGKGIIAKRSLANAAWARDDHPYSPRLRAAYDVAPAMPFTELAIRFAAFADGVSCALVGTRSIANLEEATRQCVKGVLDRESDHEARKKFVAFGASWPGLV